MAFIQWVNRFINLFIDATTTLKSTDTAPDLYYAFSIALQTEGLKPTPLAEIRPFMMYEFD